MTRTVDAGMIVQRTPGVTSEVVEGQAVLIAPAGKEVITLNPVGTLVWGALESPRAVQEVVDELLPRFTGVERQELEEDVLGFVDELRRSELDEEAEAPHV